jgi:hypothetical protein
MFEIFLTDAYDRIIERHSMYRPKAETKVSMVLDAIDRVENDKLVYGFQVSDGTKP